MIACFLNLLEISSNGPLTLSDSGHCWPGNTEISPFHCSVADYMCRVQFAKLQVFCTRKYSLITAIKDYGRLADGGCNVVLIRVWRHCNTNRMLTPSEQNGRLGPYKLYPDVDFSKLIITCRYSVSATEKKNCWESERQKMMAQRWKDWGTEKSNMQRQWEADVIFFD